MEDIMKIAKSLEDPGFLLRELVKQFKMKQKNKKENFLGAGLLGNMLAGKGIVRA